VQFRLGKYGGTDIRADALPYTQNSPYVAVCLAAYMGARRIGLIGVDFTDDHFFARTGTHPLARRLSEIDAQYGRLAAALGERGVELVNLSAESRLTSLRKVPVQEFCEVAPGRAVAVQSPARVMFVNYQFLSCGDVFTTGLRRAADELGLTHAEAMWDEPRLPEKVRSFRPDLLFVVHGRRFVQRWGDAFASYNSAVWLVDEPYEVDDTSRWSTRFDHVFLNDPATLDRHRNAHYLPVCFDPGVHKAAGAERRYDVGFIGGYNATRERALVALSDAGMLSYVVGGPWRADAVKRRCLSPNMPPAKTAELYAQTKVVVNVFREVHHYNRQGVRATSMNPRVYEALACGAAVVSESRPELAEVFPELPVFGTPQELVETTGALVRNDEARTALVEHLRSRLPAHTYAARLRKVLEVALHTPNLSLSVTTLHAVEPLPGPTAAASVTQEANQRASSARSRTFRRNLLYHVWPVKGQTWRWNVEQLLGRIDLFNGQRVVSIFHDERSEDPEAVMKLLSGHGCDFIVAPNDPRGEAAAFGKLLERVRGCDGNDVTFYGHAKGVRHEPQFSEPLRKWVEALYRVNLDDWLAVRQHLDRYAMTGAFRLHGRVALHRRVADWHYSGTFFWFRNDQVFAREASTIPDFYFGVEDWHGVMFPSAQTGCLLFDGISRIPYDARFWSDRGDRRLATWEASRRGPPVPLDLERPRPFDGYTAPRLEQIPEEFEWWVGLLLDAGVRSVLTIGGGHGGVEWHLARRFKEMGRDIRITCLDREVRPELVHSLADARRGFGQDVSLVEGDSASDDVVARLDENFDAVFIDADHGYRAAERDFSLALARKAAMIGLHDIVDSDWHAGSKCCVSRLWERLARDYRTAQRLGGEWGGIGVVWPQEGQASDEPTP
jgi:spore maturation protein CgeB/predicted O-methyltransferase YrrM